MEPKIKIQSFTDLNTWKEGHKLVVNIYMVTDLFPQKEMFGLVNQMRRCSVSITSNIAEGFSRRTDKDKYQFYSIAHGSLTELQNQLLIARDVGYLDRASFRSLANETVIVAKLLNCLKKMKNIKDIQNTKYKIPNTPKGDI